MIESIDHINIVVADLERMIRFYTELLGLKVSKRVSISGDGIDRTSGLDGDGGAAVYLEGSAGPRIELNQYHDPPGDRPQDLGQSNTQGLRHIAFRVSSIDEIVERLRRAGVHFLSDVQLVPDSQVTYADGVRKRLVYFH